MENDSVGLLSLCVAAINGSVTHEILSCIHDTNRILVTEGIRLEHAAEAAFELRGLGTQFRTWCATREDPSELVEGLRQWGTGRLIPPAALYKYRGLQTKEQLGHAKDLVCDGALYLTSPLYLNDPFDCLPGMSDILPGCTSPFLNERSTLIDVEMMVRVLVRMHAGVMSLSANPLVPSLWSHYADNHRGICVELDGTSLLRYVRASNGGTRIRQVQYRYPLKPIRLESEQALVESMKESTIQKTPAWSYEEEWRLVTWYGDDERGPDHRARLVIIPNVVRAVWIGLMASEDHKRQVAKWCELSGLPTPRLLSVDRIAGQLVVRDPLQSAT